MAYSEETPDMEATYVTNAYNKIAHHFKDTRSYSWNWITDFVNSFPEWSTIYDIGCGSGRNMKYPDYTFKGVDSCKEFVNICKKDKLDVCESSMTQLPFQDESCDGLMCIAAFHHLSNDERRIQALREMKRVVRDNGVILLSVWSKTQPKKTRRVFDSYGDTYVTWKGHDGSITERYYYIFKMPEIKKLFDKVGLVIYKHSWEVGNEVFLLTKCD